MAIADREANASYRAPRASLKISDFDVVGRIGDGSFSTVILAQLHGQPDAQQVAIKIVNKHLVVRNKMADYIRNERNILDQLSHNSIVKLLFTFQDQDSLYFGCEYCPGGDLYEQINQKGRLSLEDTRFYTAEIVQMLEYLRSKQVVHRDLKPENLLLTADGHLKLTDFGSAKAFFLPPTGGLGKTARATSFVGTAEYVSPEVLNNSPLSYPADLWALGSLVFQMLAGKPPFKGASEYLTFQKVSEREFEFPEDFPPVARDLVDKLLVLEPEGRLGAEDMTELKAHPFFAGIDWEHLRQQQAPAFKPPPPPTPELEGLDWELTSLVRDHMGLVTDTDAPGCVLAAESGSVLPPQPLPSLQGQSTSSNAHGAMPGGAQTGEGNGLVGTNGAISGAGSNAAPSSSSNQGQGVPAASELVATSGSGRPDASTSAPQPRDDDWSMLGREQPRIMYVRNPHAAGGEDTDDDD